MTRQRPSLVASEIGSGVFEGRGQRLRGDDALAGGDGLFDERAPREGRREDQGDVDRRVVENGLGGVRDGGAQAFRGELRGLRVGVVDPGHPDPLAPEQDRRLDPREVPASEQARPIHLHPSLTPLQKPIISIAAFVCLLL